MIPKALKQIHLREIGFWDLVKGGFEIWRTNFSTIVLTFASVVIPNILLRHLLSIEIKGHTYIILGALISLIANVFTGLASTVIVESALLGHKPSYGQALSQTARRFLPGLAVGVIFNLGLAAGLVLLIVPGIFFLLCFIFALPSVVLRGTSGFGAFRYSYNISKNHIVPLLLKTLGVGLMVVATLLITWPLVILQEIFPSILSAILSNILVSFPMIVMILAYLNLDYLHNGFPGQIEEEEVSEPSQILVTADFGTNTISALEERARRAQMESETRHTKRSPLLESKLFKKIAHQFLKDKDAVILEELQAEEAINPNDMRIKQKIAETYYKMNRTDEAANTYLQVARHFEAENFFMKAIKTYKNILQIKPDLVEINLKLAELYRRMNMTLEASNQYRIAITTFAGTGNKPRALALSEELVKIDPSPENRTKLAEIYQVNGMKDEALTQYESLAKQYRIEKKYEKLLAIYELILPHRPQNSAIVKDICVLHLRNQNPQRALQIIDQYKLTRDEGFKELVEKSNLMIEVLKRQKAG